MSGSRAGRMFRPIVLIGALAVAAVALSLFWESRPRGAVDVGEPGAGGLTAPTGSTTMAELSTPSTFVVTTQAWDSSSATTASPTVEITDFGPPITVGDYTRFCPAIDELVMLDDNRSGVAATDDATIERWQVDRRRVLTVIDESLNFRSPEADAAIDVLRSTAGDHPADGPLSPSAREALDTIRDFATYSCEVNSTMPSAAVAPADDITTTTGP